jgi:ATP-dependent protease ClpP protease subunit
VKENLKKAYKQVQDYRILPKLVRIKVEGEINSNLENSFFNQMNKVEKWKPDIVLIVVNSFGGSLQTAKNISYRIKKMSSDKK